MKKGLFHWLMFLAVFVNLILNSLTARAESLSTSEYFPLESGMSWTYLEDDLNSVTNTVLSGNVYINSVATKAIQQVAGEFSGEITYFSNNENGISDHKEYVPNMYVEGLGFVNMTFIPNPPLKIINATATFGDIINSYGEVTVTYSGYGTYTLGYESTTKVVGFENVTVPLGTFKTVKIQNSLTISGFINDRYVIETGTSTIWLAKYVGIVKELQTIEGVQKTTKLVNINFQPYLSANFTVDQTSAIPTQTLYFTDMSEGNISSWLWNFGDGNTSTLQNPTHFYLAPGNYTVSLKVSGLGNTANKIKTNYISIYIQDSDNDGLSDYEEENTYLTNPNNSDTDGDGLNDGDEVKIYGTDPNISDTDVDGMPDGWEVNNGLNPLVDDAGEDNDWDGASNLLEYKRGTDPINPNSKPSFVSPWLMLLLE